MVGMKVKNSINETVQNALLQFDIAALDDGFRVVFLNTEIPELNFSYDVFYRDIKSDQALYGHGLDDQQIALLKTTVDDFLKATKETEKQTIANTIMNKFLINYRTFRKEFHQCYLIQPFL